MKTTVFAQLFREVLKEEKIPGGLSKGKTVLDLAKKYTKQGQDPTQVLTAVKQQLKKGIKVELEHTTSRSVAEEIAMDHLWEDLKYYTKLAKIEKQ